MVGFPRDRLWAFPRLGGGSVEFCGEIKEKSKRNQREITLWSLVFLLNTPPVLLFPSALFYSLFYSLYISRMGVKEFLKSRSGLRVDNRATTSAATLTLRQSLWPLTLVTTLFFLWVGWLYFVQSPPTKTSIRVLHMVYWTPSTPISRKPYTSTELVQLVFKQPTLGMKCLHNTHVEKKKKKKSPRSNKTQRIPPSLPGLCKLDPPQLRLQDRLHLRSVSIRHWSPMHVASRTKPILRRFLRCHIRHWIRTGFSRDSS